MAPQRNLVSRYSSSSSNISPVYIAGFCVAGALVLVGLVWLLFRTFAKRSRIAKESAAAAVFPNDPNRPVNYVVFEKDTQYLTEPSVRTANHQILLAIPDKALTRPYAPDAKFIKPHADVASPIGPQPSAPFQFALARGKNTLSINPGPKFRPSSIFSFIASSHRSSVIDVTENRLSVMSEASLDQGASCKVRQIFDPVLPDELVVTLGDFVTLVKSFDDGWCIVGRPSMANRYDIEIGAVPTWSFLKPLKDHRPERPMRIDSLGATARLDKPATRQSIISWSKF